MTTTTLDERVAALETAAAVLAKKLEALEARGAGMETRLLERVSLAFDGHAALHKARDTAHQAEHSHNQTAIARAEQTMLETARIHAESHAREHQLAKEAVDKAAEAYSVRFESLNEARSRSQDERASFATRDQLDDKTSSINARVDVLDKQIGTLIERVSSGAGNLSRIEALEKELVGLRGRDRGVGLVWGVAIAAFGAVVAVITIVSQWR